MEKIKIQVFGLSNQPAGGGWNCGPGSCGPTPTTKEMYQDLVDYMAASDIRNLVELSFIDLMDDDIEPYQTIKQLLNRGFSPPLIAINNKKYLHGGISKQQIHRVAKELLG